MYVGLLFLVRVFLCGDWWPFCFCSRLAGEKEKAGCYALATFFDAVWLLVYCLSSSRCRGLVGGVWL